MKKYDIITFGGAVVDAFVYTGLPEEHKEICYKAGTKILVKDLKFSTGGGGTNTAATFSKMGLKTGFVGKLGKDENAQIILNELKKLKVDFLGAIGKEPTGYSVILDSKEHERTILVYKGANETLSLNEISLKKLNSNWLYLASATGETFRAEEKLAAWADKQGVKIAYNPSSYLTEKGANYLKGILKYTHTLILNDGEARDLVPSGDLFKGLLKLGPKIVCITFGPKGNQVSDGNKLFISYPRPIKVVERTGAGDAFGAGFVSAMIKTGDLETAIQVGSLNAESVIQIPGAKNGLLSWNEAMKEMKSNPVKIEVKDI